jgi:elongation factor Ts
MAVSIEQIKQLREETGAGIMDCRKALEQADGDVQKAIEALREKGLATAAKRADREASEGFRTLAHELALQIAAAAPLYIRDEDIPAAVLDHERNLARQVALEEGKPEAVAERIVEGRLAKYMDETVLLRQVYIRDDTLTIQQLMMDKVASIGENIVIRRFVRWELGKSAEE